MPGIELGLAEKSTITSNKGLDFCEALQNVTSSSSTLIGTLLYETPRVLQQILRLLVLKEFIGSPGPASSSLSNFPKCLLIAISLELNEPKVT